MACWPAAHACTPTCCRLLAALTWAFFSGRVSPLGPLIWLHSTLAVSTRGMAQDSWEKPCCSMWLMSLSSDSFSLFVVILKS